MTIGVLQSSREYEEAKQLDIESGPISRLAELIQAVPAVLAAAQTSGKHLMEVVINGDLVHASDGNGLRAFTRGVRGIVQQARLFEVSNLQNLMNAGAICKSLLFWLLRSI